VDDVPEEADRLYYRFGPNEMQHSLPPIHHPNDEDLSLGTPIITPTTKTCRWGPRYRKKRGMDGAQHFKTSVQDQSSNFCIDHCGTFGFKTIDAAQRASQTEIEIDCARCIL
jgi:hypothetical protein